MTPKLINVFLENTSLPLDVIKLIVNRVETSRFEFGKIYKEREEDVWKFKVIKKTQHYVTLGQFINPNLPHRSEYKRKIRYDCLGSEYITLHHTNSKLYA
jgi:hypothetical protein